ncbi:MAG: membrane-anchored protein YejM (alkaline phosphatase superfamily) [Planctomycetota bacterium]|jgi:membrane-anchored protein YejM (alkaline phosphatase superfamily)
MTDKAKGATPIAPRLELRVFWMLAYVLAVLACTPFFLAMEQPDLRTGFFSIGVWVTYPLIYLLPAIGLTALVRSLVVRLGGRDSDGSPRHWARTLVSVLAVLGASGTIALLFTDQRIHELYGFHINGFVLNIVTTEGGLESMGAGQSTYVVIALGSLALLLGVSALLWLSCRLPSGCRPNFRWAIPLLLFTVGERVIYGISHVQGHVSVLVGADAFPLYSRLTFDSLASDLGYEVVRQEGAPNLGEQSGQLHYPLEPLAIAPDAPTPNIVWIAVESWRWDTVTPEIMPRTFAFAEQTTLFKQHYSGGNGTRMGVFSMFYGIYGAYWFSMLDERRGPVLIDTLLEQDYQMSVNTSAKFTYPEFNETVFARVSEEDLKEWSGGPGWERDRAHVGGVLDFIEERDPARPFFTFSFLESPHARYTFPEECAVAKPYLEDFNYATMSLEDDIELIHNRYLNSCNHLDGQVGRILDYLESEGLMENTIVVLTGDHGEEFLEKGNWGHGSTFSEEQIRVPLILHVPSRDPAQVERLTSHMDLPATILPLLGVTNEPSLISQGLDLFGTATRDHVVLADWSRICLLTDTLKTSLPLKAKGFFRNKVTTRDDQPLEVDQEIPVGVLQQVLEGLARFRRKRGASSAP